MTVSNYTDLFNNAMSALGTKLATATGLQVVTDPRNLRPPCVFIDAPSFTMWNYNIAKMTFPVQIISMGPGNSDALGNILNMAAAVMTANVGATSGSPTSVDIGGVVLPAYEMMIEMQAQTS